MSETQEEGITEADVKEHVEIPRRLPNLNIYDQPRDRVILCVPFIKPNSIDDVAFNHFTEEDEDWLRVTTLYENGKAYSFVMDTDEETLKRLNSNNVKLVDADTFGELTDAITDEAEE